MSDDIEDMPAPLPPPSVVGKAFLKWQASLNRAPDSWESFHAGWRAKVNAIDAAKRAPTRAGPDHEWIPFPEEGLEKCKWCKAERPITGGTP